LTLKVLLLLLLLDFLVSIGLMIDSATLTGNMAARLNILVPLVNAYVTM
jgi:hypothetical protein